MSKQKCPPRGAPGWIVTYADLMSLLFTFFVMMYMLSSVDAKKAETVAQSFRETFGTSKNMYVPIPGRPDWPQNSTNANRQQTVKTVLSGNPTRVTSMPAHVPKEKIMKGIITFENASDTLSTESLRAIKDIYAQLKGSPLMIEVRGHTGLHEQSVNRDLMDLAYARGHAVRNALLELGTDPSRIFITSMGSIHTKGMPPVQTGAAYSYVEILLISETPNSSL